MKYDPEQIPLHIALVYSLTYVLMKYRRIMDAIHEGGNIYYNKDRMDAYVIIVKLNSDTILKSGGL